MAYEHKENSGSLFKNLTKKSDNHPDYNGKVNIAGQTLEVSGWVKESNGKKWLSLSFREPRQVDSSAPTSTAQFDDMPF